MAALIRLAYASKATIAFTNKAGGVDLGIAHILTKSRRNNPKRDIGGVLYYGNGHFFQCLEGPREAIYNLIDTLKQDARHEQFKVLMEEDIDARLFESWSMKRVAARQSISRFLASKGMARFNPYRLDTATIRELLNAFAAEQDGAAHAQTPRAVKPSAPGVLTRLKRALLGR